MKRVALCLGLWLLGAFAWMNGPFMAPVAAAEIQLPESIAKNWHQWRGPLATGVAPLSNPPTTWDENTNIKWKVKIPGDSTATPIIWNEQIFLTTAIKTDR